MDNVTGPMSSSGQLPPLQKTESVSPKNRQGVQRENSVQQRTPVTTSTLQNTFKNGGVASSEVLLPRAILESPLWTEAEWAWRRVLFQEEALQTQTQTHAPTQALGQPQAQGQMQGQVTALQSLWRVLGSLAETVGSSLGPHSPARINVAHWPFSSSVVAYSAFDKTSLQQVAPRLSPQVLADRLTTVVQSPQLPQNGAGLFLLSAPSGNEKGAAVHWQAQRRTKLGAVGQLVHRLEIDVTVENDLVHISMLYAAPHLNVFFETNNHALEERLLGHTEHLRGPLEKMGIKVEQIRAGTLSHEEWV